MPTPTKDKDQNRQAGHILGCCYKAFKIPRPWGTLGIAVRPVIVCQPTEDNLSDQDKQALASFLHRLLDTKTPGTEILKAIDHWFEDRESAPVRTVEDTDLEPVILIGKRTK